MNRFFIAPLLAGAVYAGAVFAAIAALGGGLWFGFFYFGPNGGLATVALIVFLLLSWACGMARMDDGDFARGLDGLSKSNEVER